VLVSLKRKTGGARIISSNQCCLINACFLSVGAFQLSEQQTELNVGSSFFYPSTKLSSENSTNPSGHFDLHKLTILLPIFMQKSRRRHFIEIVVCFKCRPLLHKGICCLH
jgi:hypothetical protein